MVTGNRGGGNKKKAAAKKTATKKKTVKKATVKKKSLTKKANVKKASTKKSTAKKAKASNPRKKAKKIGASAANSLPRHRGKLAFIIIAISIVAIMLGIIGLLILDSQVRGKFEGHRWQIPAKVYARPLELYTGKNIKAQQFEAELHRLNYRKSKTPDDPGEYAKQGNQITFIKRSFEFPDQTEAAQAIVATFNSVGVERLLDSNSGNYIGLVRLEPLMIGGFYPQHKEDRILVKLNEVPDEFIELLLRTEDQYFFEHRGISWRGIARAFWVNITSGAVRQGGSTLTQQLVKNFYLNNERSLTRKLIEVLMSGLLELHYSKEEILEAYLNEIYLGQQGQFAIHGIGLAAEYYFDRPLPQLKLEQMALLVALAKGASYYNPWKHAERALERRNQVLEMLKDGSTLFSAEQLLSVQSLPLGLANSTQRSRHRYPAYMNLVRRQIAEDYATEDLISEGLRIFTHLDPMIQSSAEKVLQSEIELLEQQGKVAAKKLQGAVVVLEPNSGEIVAIVGDREARFAGFNRAIDASRPVGSIIKPGVFLAAIESGEFNFASLIEDEPITLENEDGSLWQPENYNGETEGLITLQKALAKSINLATANLGLHIGVDRVIAVLKEMGLDKNPRPLPSLLLGALALTPIEVSQLYQTIAAQGFHSPIKTIQSVLNQEALVLSRYPFQIEKRFSTPSMLALQAAMQSVLKRGTAISARQWLDPNLNAAGKTGTTDQQRDSWFAGYTQDYLTVVWLGRDDNATTKLTGSNGALRVWSKLMSRHARLPLQQVLPASMAEVWIEGNDGLLANEHCDNAYVVVMAKDQVPQERSECAKARGIRGWIDRIF